MAPDLLAAGRASLLRPGYRLVFRLVFLLVFLLVFRLLPLWADRKGGFGLELASPPKRGQQRAMC